MPNKAALSTIHASMVVINQKGFLISGVAGTGKSELCLQLLDRSHKLVSDDMVRLWDEGILTGSAPNTLYGKLAIRDIGIIDVIKQFGSQALCQNHQIDYYIRLTTTTPQPNPLNTQAQYKTIGQFSIPSYTISSTIKRPIPLLLETIAKHALILHCEQLMDTLNNPG